MNLENTKVYTTDEEVVRMYGELAGVDFTKLTIFGKASAYYVRELESKSHGACVHKSRAQGAEITEQQIRDLHREKFPEQYKKMRVEYEPLLEMQNWELFKLMSEDGDLYINCADLSFEGLDGDVINLANAIHDGSVIYRKIEKEIDWRDEVCSFLESCDYIDKDSQLESFTYKENPVDKVTDKINEDYDNEFLELCRVALRATGELE